VPNRRHIRPRRSADPDEDVPARQPHTPNCCQELLSPNHGLSPKRRLLLSALVRKRLLKSGVWLAEGEGFEPPGAWRPLRFSSSSRAVLSGVVMCHRVTCRTRCERVESHRIASRDALCRVVREQNVSTCEPLKPSDCVARYLRNQARPPNCARHPKGRQGSVATFGESKFGSIARPLDPFGASLTDPTVAGRSTLQAALGQRSCHMPTLNTQEGWAGPGTMPTLCQPWVVTSCINLRSRSVHSAHRRVACAYA
jgi:hypothetical protein